MRETVRATEQKEIQKSSSAKPASANSYWQAAPLHPALNLQQKIGNRAMQRLVRSGVLQAKLEINQPGDIYEQEADRVADAVMRMPDPVLQRCSCGGMANSEGECAGCRAKRLAMLQRQATTGTEPLTAPQIVDEVLNSSGQPLDAETRAFMEPRFGYDFSHVRVHTDGRAAESARAVNALAYTVGQDIVFATGQYALGTGEGKRLMAHELTHVLQQTSGVQPRDKFEQEPEQVTRQLSLEDESDNPYDDESLSMWNYGSGDGETLPQACERAKDACKSKCPPGSRVEFDKCSCNKSGWWVDGLIPGWTCDIRCRCPEPTEPIT